MNEPAVDYATVMGRDYPEFGPGPLDISSYYTAENFEREREKVFNTSWLWAGCRAEELADTGSYKVIDVASWNTSIILVRGADAHIRGFHNVCSHRLNRVAYNSAGRSPHGFVCKFHGWAYDCHGRLAAVPLEDMFCDLEKAEHGLTPVSVGVWEGFVFINRDSNPARSLLDHLGEMAHGYEGYFDGYAKVAQMTNVVQANWKICRDAFIETYHFAFVHAASTPNGLMSPKNPYGLMDAAVLYDTHGVASAQATIGPDYQPTSSELLVARYGKDFSGARRQTAAINPRRFSDWVSDVLVIFPTAIFQPFGNLGGWYITQAYWPIAHDKTRWEMTLYMPPATNAGEWLAHERNASYLRDVVREDWHNMEMIQSNLASGAKHTIQLGDQEVILRHAYTVLDRLMRA